MRASDEAFSKKTVKNTAKNSKIRMMMIISLVWPTNNRPIFLT
jgi:hypothetical protein